MAEAFRSGAVPRGAGAPRPDTIADGIAVRVPIPEALADMAGLVDDMVLVGDVEMIEAMRLLHEHVGLVVEPAGAAGLAALRAIPELAVGSVATVLCGGNLTPDQLRVWLGPGAVAAGPMLS